jgi:transposase
LKSNYYSPEFKASTIQLAMNSQEPMRKIAKDLGVSDKTVYRWIKEHNELSNNCIPINQKSCLNPKNAAIFLV